MINTIVIKMRDFGITPETDPDEIRNIKFTNALIIIAFAAAFAYIPYLLFYLPGSALLIAVVSLQCVFYAVAFTGNYYHKYFFARNVLSFGALISTVIESFLTNLYCDIHFFLLLGIMFVFFIYPDKERKFSYFIAGIYAFSYLAIEIYSGLSSPLPLPSQYIVNVTHVIRSALLIIVFIYSFYAYYTIHQYQTQLKTDIEKMDMEISLARRIQEQCIPEKTPAGNISAVYKPMHEVGGDFYDFIEFKDSDNIGIFLSDVSGHGVPAAFITSMIKTIILQAGEKLNDPANFLLYMNDVLESRTAGNFFTAFYCIYNPDDKSIYYSNAGHNQPYIITEKNVVQLQKAKSTAIAMFPNHMLTKANKIFKNNKLILEPGSKLLLYTDGLVETRPIDGDTLFECSNMEKVFIENHKYQCDVFLNKLMNELSIFRKSNQFDDDICLICLDV